MKKFKKGFTLIELLVVISIIAVLAAIVLASLNGARQKGNIASGQEFAANVYHRFGADNLIGMWNFNEGSNTTLNDSSVNGYNLTLNGAAAFTTDTPSGNDFAINRTGSGANVQIAHETIPNPATSIDLGNNGLTFSLWIKPLDCSTESIQLFLGLINGNSGYFTEYVSGANGTCSVNVSGNERDDFDDTYSNVLTSNQWQQVTYTYIQGQSSVYINGHLSSSKTAHNFTDAGIIKQIIINASANLGADSVSIDDVAIYNTALTASAIQKLYAETAPAHGIALK